jgi:hypothetical protein
MSQAVVSSRHDYQQQYHAAHKEEINKRKAEQYGLKKLEETIGNIDLEKEIRSIMTALESFDESDKSEANLQWSDQITVYAQLITTLKFMSSSEEAKAKATPLLNVLNSVPLESRTLPPIPPRFD